MLSLRRLSLCITFVFLTSSVMWLDPHFMRELLAATSSPKPVYRYASAASYVNGTSLNGTYLDTQQNDSSYQVSRAVGFTMSVSPSTQSITAGTSATYTVTVSSLNAFSAPVSLTASISPTGPSYSFSSIRVTPPANAQASSSLTVTSAYTGTYTITVTAQSTPMTTSASVTLSVSSGSGGGSPFAWVWNGGSYVIDDDIIPAGMLSTQDVVDYYKLQQPLQSSQDGTLPLLVNEFESNMDYLDQVKLLAVDHLSNVSLAVSPTGQFLTYSSPIPTFSAKLQNGTDVTTLVNTIDGKYFEGYAGDSVVAKFSGIHTKNGVRLLLRSDMKSCGCSILVQTLAVNGTWLTRSTIHPRALWSMDVVDLGSYLPDGQNDFKVRLYFTAHHKLDFVALDTTPQTSVSVHEAALQSAVHSLDGDVLGKLSNKDGVYAVLTPGQQIALSFLPSSGVPSGMIRDYVVYAVGHYTLYSSGVSSVSSDPYALNVVYTFTTGGLPTANISEIRVYALAHTDKASSSLVSLNVWNFAYSRWDFVGSLPAQTSDVSLNVSLASVSAYIESGGNIKFQWFFNSPDLQLLYVNQQVVRLLDPSSNVDVTVTAQYQDTYTNTTYVAPYARVALYDESLGGAVTCFCVADGSGSTVFSLQRNGKYDLEASSSDYGYARRTISIPGTATTMTVNLTMASPRLSTNVLPQGTPRNEPLFQVYVSMQDVINNQQNIPYDLSKVPFHIAFEPYAHLVNLTSRPPYLPYNSTSASSWNINWSNTTIVFYLAKNATSYLNLTEDYGGIGSFYAKSLPSGLIFGSDISKPSFNFTGYYPAYNPWAPGFNVQWSKSPGGLSYIALYGLGSDFAGCGDTCRGVIKELNSFVGSPDQGSIIGMLAVGYASVWPLDYALDTSTLPVLAKTPLTDPSRLSGPSANSFYSVLRASGSVTGQVWANFPGDLLDGGSGGGAADYHYANYTASVLNSSSYVAYSTGLIPQRFFLYQVMPSVDSQFYAWRFTSLAATTAVNAQAYLDSSLPTQWRLTATGIRGFAGSISTDLSSSIRDSVIFRTVIGQVQAQTLAHALNPSLQNSANSYVNWTWNSWWQKVISPSLVSSSVRILDFKNSFYMGGIEGYLAAIMQGQTNLNSTFFGAPDGTPGVIISPISINKNYDGSFNITSKVFYYAIQGSKIWVERTLRLSMAGTSPGHVMEDTTRTYTINAEISREGYKYPSALVDLGGSCSQTRRMARVHLVHRNA